MEKRVRFRSLTLPWLLLAPQLAVIIVFFFWPAGQALLQSVQMQDAFGTSTEFVGLENFQRLFADELYIESFRTTAVFSILVAVCGIGLIGALPSPGAGADAARIAQQARPHEARWSRAARTPCRPRRRSTPRDTWAAPAPAETCAAR